MTEPANPEARLEQAPLAMKVFLWLMMGLNILLNIYAGLLLVAFLLRAVNPSAARAIPPNYGSLILPSLSVLATVISAIGTGLFRRWAAIVFLVLTVIGMFSVFGGGFNAPALTLYFLSIIAVILSWRWLR